MGHNKSTLPFYNSHVILLLEHYYKTVYYWQLPLLQISPKPFIFSYLIEIIYKLKSPYDFNFNSKSYCNFLWEICNLPPNKLTFCTASPTNLTCCTAHPHPKKLTFLYHAPNSVTFSVKFNGGGVKLEVYSLN